MSIFKKIKKVAIIGPECTGKSDLSAFLAKELNTVWVPEFARAYLEKIDRPYVQHDLTQIAHGQTDLEDQLVDEANDVLICDTNLYVIKIWSFVKYNDCDPVVMNAIQNRDYDLYLLTYIDIPWEDDPLREHPAFREELYDLYLQELKNQPIPFIEIRGERSVRRKTALEAVKKLLRT